MGTRADALRRERRRATTTFGAEKKNAANGIKTLSRRNISTRRVFRRRVVDETRLASSSARARALRLRVDDGDRVDLHERAQGQPLRLDRRPRR